MFCFFAPFNITVLPDLIQSAATSEATFGRDSKITAINPKGTVTLVIFKPLGLVILFNIFPNGSSNFEIFKISL